jgi:transposase
MMPVPEPDDGLPVEICFANGRTLRCPAGMAEADILRLIRLVETP